MDGEAYNVDAVQFLDVALEMEPLAHAAQLFGHFLRVARLGAVQDQDAAVRRRWCCRHGAAGVDAVYDVLWFPLVTERVARCSFVCWHKQRVVQGHDRHRHVELSNQLRSWW